VNTSVRTTLNFGLRRLPAPETFTGQITSDSHCSATSNPCAQQNFEMRRPGAVDVIVTWDGGTETTLAVQLVNQTFGIVKDVRGAPDGDRRIAFNHPVYWAGAWFLRIINMDGSGSPASASLPLTVTLTRWD
jgi:hypothetical protein